MPTPDERLKLVLKTINESESRHHAIHIMLKNFFFTPPSVLRALGKDVVEEILQEVIIKLLIPPHQGFVESDSPYAYAQRAFKNALKDRLKTFARRRSLLDNNHEPVAENKLSDKESIHIKIDAALVLTKFVHLLSPTQRVAVLLSHAPALIDPEDWQSIETDQEIPEHPLDDDMASTILYPAKANELAPDASRRQQNSFRRLRKRAYDKLREALPED